MPTDTNSSDNPPDVALVQLVFGKCMSMAISVVAKLRVADLLADGPKSVADLATRTNSHAPSLYRVLRALAAVGVFTELADGRFALTPMSEYLAQASRARCAAWPTSSAPTGAGGPGAICLKPSRRAAPPLTAFLANQYSTISPSTPTRQLSSTRA